MKKVDLAYVAGLTDGEGCIGIQQLKLCGKKTGYRYALYIGLAMTESYLPHWLQMSFGGGLYVKKQRNVDTQKDLWDWKVSGEAASMFLKAILPYLRIKKPQAEIALRFYGIVEQKGKWSHCNAFEKLEMEKLHGQIRELNKRGKNARGNQSQMPLLRDDAHVEPACRGG